MNTADLINAFYAMADAMEQKRQHLCDLDGAIGDADHGVTMALGFNAVRQTLNELKPDDASPSDVFNHAAKSFLNAVGASAGPLYATAFMRAGAAVKGKQILDSQSLADVIVAMAKGIQDRGKAQAGDKTMLDAWLPAAQAAEQHRTSSDPTTLLAAVAEAAENGAESTIELISRKGRSAKLGERSRGHMDAGAASTAILLRAFSSTLSKAR